MDVRNSLAKFLKLTNLTNLGPWETGGIVKNSVKEISILHHFIKILKVPTLNLTDICHRYIYIEVIISEKAGMG